MDKLEQIGSLAGIFIIFVLILYGSYICSKKTAKLSFGGNCSKYMTVVDRIPLGKDTYAVIISLGERLFLVGVGTGGAELISELSDKDLEERLKPESLFKDTINFKEMLKKINRDKKM